MEKKTLTHLGSKNTKYAYESSCAELLETFENPHTDQIHLVSFTQPRDEFTSLCPATGQPDQAKIELLYVPNQKMVESKSLKLYFFSYRNQGSFHEDIINTMAKDLWVLMNPKYLRIFGDFCPRGGIAIKPLVEKWNDQISNEEKAAVKDLTEIWDRKR